jgi:hypothetical protein
MSPARLLIAKFHVSGSFERNLALSFLPYQLDYGVIMKFGDGR